MKTQSSNVIVAAPFLSPFIKQAVLGYYEQNLLDKFCTSFCYDPSNKFSKLIDKIIPQLTRELNRRSFDELPKSYLKTYPYKELLRSIATKKTNANLADLIWEWSELSFDNWASKYVSKSNAKYIHVYEHASLKTLQTAKAKGIFSVYDQPSQHHSFFTKVAQQQLALYPSLKSQQTSLLLDEKSVKRNARRDEELAAASMVLCASTFTKNTLSAGGVDANKIKIIPYGFPAVSVQKNHSTKNKVVFLNAGTQNLRKALHILYQAWRNCNFNETEAELWLIGKMDLPEDLRKDLPGKVVIKESIPHTELMDLYKQVDVFVLPTLADGFGMVITESMSRGVPVITTQNSAGPDIIDHMKDGWVIEAGEIEPLVKQMKWCVENKDSLPAFGNAAMEKAKHWQWSDYRKKVSQIAVENSAN